VRCMQEKLNAGYNEDDGCESATKYSGDIVESEVASDMFSPILRPSSD